MAVVPWATAFVARRVGRAYLRMGVPDERGAPYLQDLILLSRKFLPAPNRVLSPETEGFAVNPYPYLLE